MLEHPCASRITCSSVTPRVHRRRREWTVRGSSQVRPRDRCGSLHHRPRPLQGTVTRAGWRCGLLATSRDGPSCALVSRGRRGAGVGPSGPACWSASWTNEIGVARHARCLAASCLAPMAGWWWFSESPVARADVTTPRARDPRAEADPPARPVRLGRSAGRRPWARGWLG